MSEGETINRLTDGVYTFESDKALVEAFRVEATRKSAFTALMEKYRVRVYRQIRRMVHRHDDADDLTQNTFVKVWKSLERFEGQSSFSTWIYRIAVNESLNFLASEKKRKAESLFYEDGETRDIAGYESGFTGEEIQRKLEEALMRLPDKQRLVFNMKYYDDMKYEEISEVLGTSVGALKASYHLAVKKIEDFLNDD